MPLLAIDTCHQFASIAIINDQGSVIASYTDNEPNRQAEHIFTFIDQALEEASLTWKSIDTLSVTRGPGSFTGLRIGLAAIKGLSLGSNIPSHGFSALDILAWHSKALSDNRNTPITVVIDARRGQVYFQQFNADLSPLSAPSLYTYQEAADIINQSTSCLIGTGIPAIKPLLSDKQTIELLAEINVNASLLATYSYWYMQQENTPTATSDSITPLYIRPPDAKVSSKK